MKELINKYRYLERLISREKGDFILFALFLREDAVDKWDLAVAAPWIDANRKDALSYIANQVQARFKPEELASLSRIVLINQTNPALRTINRTVTIKHGTAEVQNPDFFGFQIKHAYIVTSQKPGVDAVLSAG